MLSKLSQMRPRHGLVWIVALTTFLHGAAINGHAAPSPGTKVTPEESGKKAVGFFEEATIGVNVQERAASPVLPPQHFSHSDFERLVCEGRNIHELMKATIAQADDIINGNSQSLLTDYDDLAKYGWVSRQTDRGEQFYQRYGYWLGASINKAENHDRRIQHSQPWKNPHNGRMMSPTHGYFQNIYNIRDRVLYIIARHSPSAMVKNDRSLTLPPLKFWSDVTFLEWAHEQHNAGSALVHAPKYIAVYGVVNVDTRGLLSYLKQTRGIKEWGDLPGGVEFRSDDPAYFALLATPNIYGCAYFLSQHKAQMNIHVIESIKVFKGEILPNLLIKIIERPNEVEKDTSIRASISSAPTNKIHYNSSSSYSKL